MVIVEDTRQHRGKHEAKHEWWAAHGVEVVRRKLDTGDYMTDGSNITIDTKKGLAEIAGNIGGKAHGRFKRECVRAADAGLRLVVLIECVGYSNVSDVRTWTNTHCTKCMYRSQRRCDPSDARGKCMKHGTHKPIQGDRLSKAMQTMTDRYGVVFDFCRPRDAARRICELLGVKYKQ